MLFRPLLFVPSVQRELSQELKHSRSTTSHMLIIFNLKEKRKIGTTQQESNTTNWSMRKQTLLSSKNKLRNSYNCILHTSKYYYNRYLAITSRIYNYTVHRKNWIRNFCNSILQTAYSYNNLKCQQANKWGQVKKHPQFHSTPFTILRQSTTILNTLQSLSSLSKNKTRGFYNSTNFTMQQESNMTSSNIPQAQFSPLYFSLIIHLKVRSGVSRTQIITRLAFTVLARQQ